MRMASFVALAGLAAFVAYCFRRNDQLRNAAGREVRDDIRRWETEGGNVPSVATPSPVTTYAPGGDPNIRH